MALPQIPRVDLLDVLQKKAGEQVTEPELDTFLIEMLAWLNTGPARCRDDWVDWDDLPGEAHGILIGTLSRQINGGGSNVVQERVGDYSVQYADSALFEGRHPTYFLDSEEVALSRIAGCGGSLGGIRLGGIDLKGDSDLSGALGARDRSDRQEVG